MKRVCSVSAGSSDKRRGNFGIIRSSGARLVGGGADIPVDALPVHTTTTSVFFIFCLGATVAPDMIYKDVQETTETLGKPYA